MAAPRRGTAACGGGDTVAREGTFPSGLSSLRAALAAPFVMHIGEWTGSKHSARPDTKTAGPPPYTTNASWEWVVESEASIPTPGSDGAARFWDALFGWMASVGLDTYKLDHSQTQQPNMRYLLTTPGSTETWLRTMAHAAARHGIHKMYGGHISSGFLHSTQLPNALTARISYDYIPELLRSKRACDGADPRTTAPKGNVLLGANSLYPWAVGLRPYKDAFLSAPQRWNATTCLTVGPLPDAAGDGEYYYTLPEWWDVQEAFPELQALVSVLTAGPVAVADGIGDTDATLAKRTCRADGVLLKPDRPALAVDAWWSQQAFGHGGPRGEVTQTATTIGTGAAALRWHFVLGCDLSAEYTVEPRELLPEGMGHTSVGVAWRRQYGEEWRAPLASELVEFNESAPLRLPLPATSEDRWGEYTLWRTAPITCGGRGWALLGEPAKMAHASAQRLAAVTPTCTGAPSLDVLALGEPGETVELAFRAPSGSVHTAALRVGPDGKAHAHMPPSA